MLRTLINISKQQLLLPFYHLVADKNPAFIKHLYTPKTKTEFKADLACFLHYFESISLQKTIATNTQNKKLEKASFHLTFDDGLANFYHTIAPILKQKNIKATVFLNSDFIDNKDLFYRYKASLLIENYLNSDKEKQEIYEKFAQKNGKTKQVKPFLLGITYLQKKWLDQLANLVNYSFTKFLQTEKPYLSLQQIKELQQQGFTFGAHSTDHPLYQDLTLKEQILQTKNSLNWLQKNLKTNYRVFAFPFYDYNLKADLFKNIQNVIDLSFGTSGIKNDAISFNLQRLDMEKNTTNIKTYLIKNYLKFILQKAINKHQVKR